VTSGRADARCASCLMMWQQSQRRRQRCQHRARCVRATRTDALCAARASCAPAHRASAASHAACCCVTPHSSLRETGRDHEWRRRPNLGRRDHGGHCSSLWRGHCAVRAGALWLGWVCHAPVRSTAHSRACSAPQTLKPCHLAHALAHTHTHTHTRTHAHTKRTHTHTHNTHTQTPGTPCWKSP
jgi:hypothetical protein